MLVGRIEVRKNLKGRVLVPACTVTSPILQLFGVTSFNCQMYWLGIDAEYARHFPAVIHEPGQCAPGNCGRVDCRSYIDVAPVEPRQHTLLRN